MSAVTVGKRLARIALMIALVPAGSAADPVTGTAPEAPVDVATDGSTEDPADTAPEISIALAELDSGDIAHATRRLRSVVDRQPGNRDARLWLARSLGRSGDYPDSRRHFQSLIVRDPDDVEARIGLADVLTWQRDFVEAESVLRLLALDRPDDPEVWRRRGTIALRAGEREPAIEYFNQALALDPDHTPAMRGLVRALSPRPRTWTVVSELGARSLRAENGLHANEGWVALGIEDSAWIVRARVRTYSRFDRRESRGEAEITHRWRGRTLRIDVGLSPGAELLARRSGEAAIGWPLLPGFVGYLSGRHSTFADASVFRAGVGVEVYPSAGLALYGQFARSNTRFDGGGDAADDAWVARVTRFFSRGARVWAFIAGGSESFETGTPVIGETASDALGVGGRLGLARRWELDAVGERRVWRGGETHLTLTGAVRHRY